MCHALFEPLWTLTDPIGPPMRPKTLLNSLLFKQDRRYSDPKAGGAMHTAFWWIKRLHADFHVNLTENLLTNGTFIGGGPWPTFWAIFLSPDL